MIKTNKIVMSFTSYCKRFGILLYRYDPISNNHINPSRICNHCVKTILNGILIFGQKRFIFEKISPKDK